jgi:hypothetical protein
LILSSHCRPSWISTHPGWEALETELELASWKQPRRVILTRRRLSKKTTTPKASNALPVPHQFAIWEPPEKVESYEYAVLVTSLTDEVITIVQHCRDRVVCENNFDEIKNHWGWGDFVTQKIKPCRRVARMIALIYNWWSLFVRLFEPDKHLDAIVSRPLLLHAVGKQTSHAFHKTLRTRSTHGKESHVRKAYERITLFFNQLKAIAPQLTPIQCWYRILSEAMKKYLGDRCYIPPDLITSSI